MELSRKLLTAAKLPAEVLATLRECEPTTLGGIADTYDARLLGIADYGTRIAAVALDTHENPEAFIKKTQRLAREFAPLLPGAADLITPALRHADDRLGSFSRRNGVRSLPTASLHRVRLRRKQLAPEETGAGPIAVTALPAERTPLGLAAIARASAEAADARGVDGVGYAQAGAEGSQVHPQGRRTGADEGREERNFVVPAFTVPTVAFDSAIPWETSLAASDAFAAQPFAADPLDPETATLALIRDLLEAEDCWLFRARHGHTPLTLVGGMGPIWEHARPEAAIRGSERSVFGVALSRREVVVIHDAREASIAPYLPAWWRDLAEAPQAALLIPIEIEGQVPLLLLAGWLEARRLTAAPARVNFARQTAASHLRGARPATAAPFPPVPAVA